MANDTLKKLHWLGHDVFRMEAAGKTLYIDPYKLPPGQPKADLILITHEHHDHFSPEDISTIAGPDTAYVTCASVAESLRGDVHVLKPGDKVTVLGVRIEAVPAYNVNKENHPKSAGHLGFVVHVDDKRVYHAGDTDLIPEMFEIRCDIALLPVSGIYAMTADEAVEAVGRIRPSLAVPMHFGAIVGVRKDAERFAKRSPVPTVIMEQEE